MPASNIIVSVTDPDRLIAGTEPTSPFVVAYIEVYRYASEANARSDASSTLIDAGSGYTFTLIATTEDETAEAGPRRFAIYDAAQASTSWYRLRYANALQDTFSQLSAPWQSDRRDELAVRDIVWEAGQSLGIMLKGTAGTNGVASEVLCVELWKSNLLDALLYEGWDFICSKDAAGGGAAPENETAMIASIDTATGIATLDRDLTSVTIGDEFLICAYVSFDQIIRIMNNQREEMYFKAWEDIALHPTIDKYPAPFGVDTEDEVIEGLGVRVHDVASSSRQDEFDIDWRLENDGYQSWLFIPPGQGTKVARFHIQRTYRDLEGSLTLMADTTRAQLSWMRPALAFGIAEWLTKSDGDEPEFARLESKTEGAARSASGKYAPEIIRKAKRGSGRRSLPGPARVR